MISKFSIKNDMKIKNIFLSLFALFGVVALFVAAGQALGTSSTKAYEYTWDLDTLTNTANDTLYLDTDATISAPGDLITSNWYGTLQADGNQISGTQGIAIIVEASNFRTPDADQWFEVARDTLSGSLEQEVIEIGRMGSAYYRIIMDGYEATQSVEYEPALFLKKD